MANRERDRTQAQQGGRGDRSPEGGDEQIGGRSDERIRDVNDEEDEEFEDTEELDEEQDDSDTM